MYSFCFFPFLMFFFLIIVKFSYQNKPLVTRKLNQLEYAVFLRSLLGKILLYLIISVLHLHNTLTQFITINTHLVAAERWFGVVNHWLHSALRPVLPLLSH